MAEQLKPCPYCQGTDLKILPRNYIDGDGFVLTCQNGDCIARIWGHDETDVVARWNRRATGPATAAMLDAFRGRETQVYFYNDLQGQQMIRAFIAEWSDPATPPTPEQPEPSSPWTCCICGGHVRIGDDLRPYHLSNTLENCHAAELSDEDRKILADGLRLTD